MELEEENRQLRADLVRLAELEEILSMFGSLTYEEIKERNEILIKYL